MIIGIILLIGCIVGFLSTFLGIGGGAIIVPSLYLCFKGIPSTIVISTSLALIFVNSTINSFKFYNRGQKIDYKLGFKIGIFCIIGAVIGSFLIQSLPSHIVKKIFGCILIALSLRLFLTKEKLNTSEVSKTPKSLFLIIFSGTFGGFISSITGLGGGAIFVPMFISVLKIPLKEVSIYSNLCMVFASLFGLIPHLLKDPDTQWAQIEMLQSYYVGYVSIPILVCLFIGSNLTNGIGIKFNATVEAKKKKMIFAILLIVLGTRTLL